jgi:pimeloyl-ACP methyl ester carboxylesterase
MNGNSSILQRTQPVASFCGTTSAGVYYEVHGGAGPPLFLAFPVSASPDALPSGAGGPIANSFLPLLTDRYRVLIADYPSIGRSATVPAAELTIDRVCADLLGVADAAGFSRFAWWGGTFGAIAGLHLAAAHPQRISAFISAGWPPLDAPYAAMLRGARINLRDPPPHARSILRDPAQYAQWITLYESILRSTQRSMRTRMNCPSLVVYGAESVSDVAGIPLNLSATIREHRRELETLGWRIMEIAGRDDTMILDAGTMIPPLRGFLDEVL